MNDASCRTRSISLILRDQLRLPSKMSEFQVQYPLNTDVLEAIPHNLRRTHVVRLARGLAKGDQSELVSQLCNSGKSSAATPSSAPQRRNDLASLLHSDTQNADPTTTYHLQELGLLAAAGTSQKQQILGLAESKYNKLIANKALLLAVHSRCVFDEDILQLFQNASERKKQLIVRTCARDPLRQKLTDSFVASWLKDTPDRRVIACELLHETSAGAPIFSSELKNILVRERVAKVSKSNNVDA